MKVKRFLCAALVILNLSLPVHALEREEVTNLLRQADPLQFVDRLNAWRTIAGLPSVTVDPELSRLAWYGAEAETLAGQQGHVIPRPNGVTDKFWKLASYALLRSNLYSGVSPTKYIDGFFSDYGEKNAASVGHRRLQLSPTLGKVGFGLSGDYFVEYIMDHSGSGVDWDFLAWPCPGAFPINTYAFSVYSPWSITTRNPLPENVAVEVTNLTTGYTSRPAVTLDRDHNTVIFQHPHTKGYYSVSIPGLLSYTVDLFDYDTDYLDLSPSHWAYEAAVSTNLYQPPYFQPDTPVHEGYTRYQLAVDLAEYFKLAPASSNPGIADWDEIPAEYRGAVGACWQEKILNGCDNSYFNGSGLVTRSQLTTILYREMIPWTIPN